MASLPSNTLEITETKKFLKPIAAETKDKKGVFDEIVDWAKILTKAAAQGSSDTIKSILKEIQSGLGSGIKVGEEWIELEELLRSTKIGIIVNHQRQHPSGEVASLATYLVKKWRDDIKGAKKSRERRGSMALLPLHHHQICRTASRSCTYHQQSGNGRRTRSMSI